MTHRVIREFVGHLHDQDWRKVPIARKLAALRSFFKYCVREGIAERQSGAPGAHAQAAEAHSGGAHRGGDERFFEPAGMRGREWHGGQWQKKQEGEDCPPRRERARALMRTACCCTRDRAILGIALRRGTSRQRIDRPESRRHGSEGPDAARARQRQQGAHRSLRAESGAGAGSLLAAARWTSAECRKPAAKTSAGRCIPQLPRPPADAAHRRRGL